MEHAGEDELEGESEGGGEGGGEGEEGEREGEGLGLGKAVGGVWGVLGAEEVAGEGGFGVARGVVMGPRERSRPEV
ncbi:MAG: hypothetical protein ACK5TN_20145, partial [Acidobacteriota bacterium]